MVPTRRDKGISIVPPRVGRDGVVVLELAGYTDFNPPSPCGEGRVAAVKGNAAQKFQSTLPVRGGTAHVGKVLDRPVISIHPPRVGRDRCPCGARTR